MTDINKTLFDLAHHAVRYRNNITFIQHVDKLLDAGADPSLQYDRRTNAFMWSCMTNGYNMFKKLLSSKNYHDLNQRNQLGNTVLIIACQLNRYEIIQMLLNNDRVTCDLNILNDNGFTALTYAINNNNHDIIKLLLDYDAIIYDVDHINNYINNNNLQLVNKQNNINYIRELKILSDLLYAFLRYENNVEILSRHPQIISLINLLPKKN